MAVSWWRRRSPRPAPSRSTNRHRRWAFPLLECLEDRVTPANFTPGDLVVLQVGDGSGALQAGVAAPLFLVEYSPAGGAPVQTIPLPTAYAGATHAISVSGTSPLQGYLSRSA